MNDRPRTPAATAARRAALCLHVVAAIHVAIGVGAMLVLAPRIPYADSWRFVVTFVTQPFPRNIAVADNGHCEVLPNLVRIADFAWFDGNQWLQIGVGIVLALGVVVALCRLWRADDAVPRAAATLIVCAGIFWLGNSRKLAHGSESVSQFIVLGCVVIGTAALRSVPRDGACSCSWLAAGAAIAATFSFGAGLATFPAFAVLLLVQRATLRQWLPLVIAAAVVVAEMRALGSGELPGTGVWERFDQLLRWLGAPFVWMLHPLLDPAHAARLPVDIVRGVSEPIASVAADSFGDALSARWPAFGFGAIGVLWLAATTWRAWRRPIRAEERVALGLVWFGFGVGVLVVLLRVSYFRQHIDQLTSQRYVSWSMVMWTGLLLSLVLRRGWPARRAAAVALCFVLALAPSQVWCGRNAWKLRATAERTAAGAAVAVLDRDFPLVETAWKDLAAALPLMREHGKAMFAWPETALLGAQPDAATIDVVTASDVTVRPVQNRFEGSGMAVHFRADGASGRVLLLDTAGTVRGLAVRMPCDLTWFGWLRGELAAAELRVAMLR